MAAEPDDLVETVKATLAREDRDELTETFYERYRARPMTAALEPLLDKLSI